MVHLDSAISHPWSFITLATGQTDATWVGLYGVGNSPFHFANTQTGRRNKRIVQLGPESGLPKNLSNAGCLITQIPPRVSPLPLVR